VCVPASFTPISCWSMGSIRYLSRVGDKPLDPGIPLFSFLPAVFLYGVSGCFFPLYIPGHSSRWQVAAIFKPCSFLPFIGCGAFLPVCPPRTAPVGANFYSFRPFHLHPVTDQSSTRRCELPCAWSLTRMFAFLCWFFSLAVALLHIFPSRRGLPHCFRATIGLVPMLYLFFAEG